MDYSSYSTEELKDAIKSDIARDTFRSDEDLMGIFDRIEEMKAEYNSRVSKDKQFSPLQNNVYAEQLLGKLKENPRWVSRPNTTIAMEQTPPEPDTAGWVDRKEPWKINITSQGTQDRNVFSHEAEHTGQLQYGLPESDDSYNARIEAILKNNPEGLASNWNKNANERYANIGSKMVQELGYGVPFAETEMGKRLGADKDPALKKYIYERTMIGIPSLYEGQEPTLKEKVTNLLDKYRRKFNF